MKIALGILAWNEETTIARTIESICSQSLLASADAENISIEIVCVPNGCTDATASVARSALRKYLGKIGQQAISWQVINLEEPGKTNAWMRLIHEFSEQSTDFVIMVDADVQFLDVDALSSLIEGLQDHPGALVASGIPIKDISLKQRKTWFDRISVSATEMIKTASYTYIVGMLYCARGEFIRRIYMPRGMIGEDAFLMRMTVTDLFTSPANFDRVIHPPKARFLFEAYKNLGVLFRQHKRRAVTRVINLMLFEYLESNSGAMGAGALIEKNNRENPLWYQELVRAKIHDRGWWVVGTSFISNRIFQIGRLGFPGFIPKLPAAIIGTIEDGFVYAAANRALKKGKIGSLWAEVRKGENVGSDVARKVVLPTLAEKD
jgi:glycosyltransferase involved in cell wall biosynthesis